MLSPLSAKMRLGTWSSASPPQTVSTLLKKPDPDIDLLDPTTDGDFETLIDAMAFREMDRGHTCVNVADAGSSIAEGDPATLQIKYIADFDSPNNQTFYACADITYVTLSNFESEIPCFNATIPDGDDSDFDHGDLPEFDDPEGEDDSDATEDDDDASDTDEIGDIATLSPEPVDMGSSGLSGGEIAGVVVGTLAGVGLIAGVVIFFYRRRQQRTRTARQQISTRGVSWEEHPGKDSTSQSSIKLQNVSA